MPTFSFNHYVPALTWKRAEQAALQSLAVAARAQITPLIDIVPIPVDLDTGGQKKTLEEHVDPAIARINTAWGAAEFFLDPAEVALDLNAQNQSGAVHVFAHAASLGLQFVPVTGLLRTPPEIAAALAHTQRGVALRLEADVLAMPNMPALLTGFLQVHHLQPARVDLILDLGAVVGMPSFAITSTAQAQIQRVPNLGAWRTLTILASAFPLNLAGIVGTTQFPRDEWQAWSSLHAMRATLPRMPAFGDYLIQSPDVQEGYDPRFMPMSPAIRYTLDNEWLILRGQSSKHQRLAAQYPNLAAQLIASSPPYYGQAHCQGCRDAAACAAYAAGFGSPEAWRRLGTMHHLTVATAQLGAVAFP